MAVRTNRTTASNRPSSLQLSSANRAFCLLTDVVLRTAAIKSDRYATANAPRRQPCCSRAYGKPFHIEPVKTADFLA